ncbi:tetratricopeptide repeat protein [Streptomyces sp. WMMC500]|uniref:tetratricopeptide repeat protein n=1 Tax=Streptomyces sp. WMMC500 TaxID=3015154 RepID=UPI00248BDEFC|nr:tetratricopeptide repeat protein [Streptomyces sp. WMMC500]WBB63917.1 tetratricopeptide repeat protein [Streptomyces sp. WMMC500]
MPRSPATWPHQVGTIPPQAGAFQHRENAEQLREAVAEDGTAVLSQVLSGMGGVGKIQLAADYARTAWQLGPEPGGVDVLIWISAGSRDTIVAGYAQAGEELCGADTGNAEQATRTFLAWLQPKPGIRPCRWLVVLDDVTNPAHVRGLWPPASPTGRTLVTTRRRDAALTGRGRVVTVGLFTEAEAVAYLTDALNTYGRSEPDDQLVSLARDLGYLPLALSQAAAYLTDTLLPCAAYRDLLADQKRKLADLIPEDDALPDDQTSTVAATWALSIEHANKIPPAGLARTMLHLAALLDPNGIPATVLTSQPALAHLTEHRTPYRGDTQASAQVSAEDAVLALRALHRLSLIDHSPTTPHQAVRVHQLIQRATWDSLDREQSACLAHTVAKALITVWPAVERDRRLAQALRANAGVFISRSQDDLWRYRDGLDILYRTGVSLGESGQAAAARDYFSSLAQEAACQLGPHRIGCLTARDHAAQWLGEAGDAAGAARAYEELLSDWLRHFHPDHPGVLVCRHNLARWRGHAGDAAGAVRAYEELLPLHLRVLGPNDPNTLTTRGSLAYWRGKAGDAAGTASAFEELLALRQAAQGPDHQDTLNARNSMASWKGEAGDPDGAVRALAELVKDDERLLGSHHPYTLAARNNLAFWRGRAGDAAGAASEFERLLEQVTEVMGADHRQTLTARSNVARWRGEAGDPAGAAIAFVELLADCERVLGLDHPDTLRTRNYLTQWQNRT